MQRLGILGIASVAVFLVLLAMLVGGRQAREDADAVPAGADAGVDVTMSGVEMRLGRDGRTLWVLKALFATYDQGEQLVLLSEPWFIKNFSDGDVPILVEAPLGQVDQGSNDIRLWSGVRMEYGATNLRSQEAVYIQVDETIYLAGDVFLDRGGLEVRAPKGDVDLATLVVNAEGGVEVVISGEAMDESL